MCGIAGYSLSEASGVDRTLAAQALLAGIAERGADAVGYAYRACDEHGASVHKQRCGASKLLERIAVPAEATQLLVHVRDYTKGHPSIAANNHPVRHGSVVGIHNGIILNDDELLAGHACARRERGMSVDSETFFASTRLALEVVEHYAGLRLRKTELAEGTLVVAEHGRQERRERFRPDRAFEEEPLPSVRAPHEGASCLARLATLAAAA